MKPLKVLELCELTEASGEICHSTLMIFIKNARVWKLLERQVVIRLFTLMAYWVSGGQGIGLQGPRWLRDGSTGSQVVKGLCYSRGGATRLG